MSAYVSLLRASSSAVSTTLELRPFRSGLVPSCMKLKSSRWPAARTVCRRQDCYGATTATPRASSPPMYAAAREDNCSDPYVQTITSCSGKWLPLSCMILVEVINSGKILLGKVSVDQGIFVFALLCYRSSLGAIFTFPFALLWERDKWKQLNWAGFKWIFLNSFVGYTLPMAMYYYGLRDTTASYAAIFTSLTPLVTFILSVIFSMEKLVIGTKAGTAKITGALLCFGGAILISLYRGKELLFACNMSVGGYHNTLEMAIGRHQLRGAMLLLGDCISSALWYPIQWKLHELYPCKLWSTFFTCVLGGLQTLTVGIAMRRDPFAWKLGWNVHLLTVLYSLVGQFPDFEWTVYIPLWKGQRTTGEDYNVRFKG